MSCNYNCMEYCEKCEFPDKVFEELSRRENGVYQLTRPDFNTIIDYCNDLEANEKLEVFEFGKNCDLVLHIYKDEEYNPKKDKEYFNLVRISTAQNGEWVDDTEDIYVTDGALHRELERIWNYIDFATL